MCKNKTKWFRLCPECGGKIHHTSAHALKRAVKDNRRCYSCSNKGENNPFYGKIHTDEWKRHLKENNPSSDPVVAMKISEALTGKPKSEEHREKLKLAALEQFKDGSPFKGMSFEERFGEDRAAELKEVVRLKALEQWDVIRDTDEYKEWLERQPEYRNYVRDVWRITNRNDLTQLENYDKRGRLVDREDAHHLDHIFPISKGFEFDIPAELIGNIKNLRMIPADENKRKNNTIYIVPEHIKNKGYYSEA